MKQKIDNIIQELSQEIEETMPQSFEEVYYMKMTYSGRNTVLECERKLLREIIGFEIAFIHVIVCVLVNVSGTFESYMSLLKKLDINGLFSWYQIQNADIIEQLKKCGFNSTKEIYDFINEHDKYINKDVKKKLGQFYTPISIVRKMILEIRGELRVLTEKELIADPACGTGVFVVEAIKQMGKFMKFDKLLCFVENNIFAYDVNPFSVIATKINVLNCLLEITEDSVQKKQMIISPPFKGNIKWKNTIVENEVNQFTIILGNPPYFKMDSNDLKEIKGYENIIYGQPNIYSLFTHWGITHLKFGGTISYIVPQSIRSGIYFKKIREEMKEWRIKSILHINSRQKIFDRAEQAVLIICLQKKPVRNSKTRIQFINGNQDVLSDYMIPRSKVMMNEEHNHMFIINKKQEMYDILDKVYNNGRTLVDETATVKFANGLFVWNQHKDDLTDFCQGAIPIIYGGSVQPTNFKFVTNWSNEKRKSYAKFTDKTCPYVLNGKRLLVQRTTNFERDIRIKACLISDDFLMQYNNYLLENHVNFLCSNIGKEELVADEMMYYYLGILNSKLLNYIFVSKSGNTQVSANELNLLPFPQKDINEIAAFVSQHMSDLSKHQEELDRIVCQAYDLSEIEKEIIINY